MHWWTILEVMYLSVIVVTSFGNCIMTKHKPEIQSFWFSNLYHFRHCWGSPGGPGTLLCTLNLKIGLEILINNLSKMFNNSTKKQSFRKSCYRNEIHTFKKTEKIINGNYNLWENPRFLICQLF